MANTAQQRPLTCEEVARLRPISAAVTPLTMTVRLRSFFASVSHDAPPPQLIARMRLLDGCEIPRKDKETLTYRMDMEVQVHGSPDGLLRPSIPSTRLSHQDLIGREAWPIATAFRPDSVSLNFVPNRSQQLRKRHLRARGKNGEWRSVRPAWIADPDRRQILNDITYPWCAIGQVLNENGAIGAGVLVGPQHLLTASHLLPWRDDGSVGWLGFTPAYSGSRSPDAPFGMADSQHVLSYRAVQGFSDEDVAEDYAVCVLDQRLGESLGWMGAKVYTEDWDDQGYWWHVGYPIDLGGGNVPYVQDQVSFEDADPPGPIGFLIDVDNGDGLDLETEDASITPGASGGPFFSWWDDGWPYVVGITSGYGPIEADNDNWAGGGAPMVHLINEALAKFP